MHSRRERLHSIWRSYLYRIQEWSESFKMGSHTIRNIGQYIYGFIPIFLTLCVLWRCSFARNWSKDYRWRVLCFDVCIPSHCSNLLHEPSLNRWITLHNLKRTSAFSWMHDLIWFYKRWNFRQRSFSV